MEIAQDIAKYIESSKPNDLDNYLTTLGEIGYQIYVTTDGEGHFFGGEYRDKTLPSNTVKRVLKGEFIMVCVIFQKRLL